MKTKLILFDIDGTILLTAGAGRRAIVRALQHEVADISRFEHVRFDGKTDPQIVCELLVAAGHPDPENEDRIQDVCRRYVSLLEHELSGVNGRTTVMPGVTALLARLETVPGIMLGLLTGNVAEGAALKLRSASIDPARFIVGAYGSDAAQRPALPAIAALRAEPHFGRIPAGHDVLIIGDTPADVTCGRAIGARAIGVATGSYTVAQLLEAGAHAAFPDLSDTDRVLEVLLP